MQLRMYLSSIAVAITLSTLPVLFLADTALAQSAPTASIGGLSTDTTVGVGTTVTFSVLSSGFTNPTYKVVDSFGGGVSNVNIDANGNLSWTPNNSDIGSHTITITVSDSSGSTANAAQTITVVVPSISIGTLLPGNSVRVGNPVTFTLTSAGFMGAQYTVTDSFPYSSITSASTNASGIFQWTPIYQDIGAHTLTATARDYQGHTATITTQITVLGLATASIGAISPGTIVHAGDLVSFSATTTGYSSPTFTISDSAASTIGTSTLAVDATGKVTWTPTANDIGGHNLLLTVSDTSGTTAHLNTLITVVPGSSTAYMQQVTPYVASTTTQTPSISASPSAYVFKNLLTVGSSGSDVTALQQLLVTLGFLQVTPTGYFGALTKAALQKYQMAHSISPVGYAGPATRASLSTGK